MISAIDANVLLDILLPDPFHVDASKKLIDFLRGIGGFTAHISLSLSS